MYLHFVIIGQPSWVFSIKTYTIIFVFLFLSFCFTSSILCFSLLHLHFFWPHNLIFNLQSVYLSLHSLCSIFPTLSYIPSLFPSLSFILSSLISFIPSNPHLFFIVKEGREQDIVLPQSALLVVCTERTTAQVKLKHLKQAWVKDLWDPLCGIGKVFFPLFSPTKMITLLLFL